MEGNRSSGWEMQKENIRPLSSGRNVTLLKHSLETSMRNMTDYEEETDQRVKVLEELTKSYKGEDPIEPWLDLITFLESSCVLVAKLKLKLTTVLKLCTKLFLQAPQYKNDKRFLGVYMKSVADIDPLKRVQVHQLHLASGLGIKCSLLYLAIAELEESTGKPLDAVKSLKKGIIAEAQPIAEIKDALSQLEYRVAQRLANSVLSEEGIAAAVADSRNFGTSVPVYGPSNEAPAFRIDLQPAIPVSSSRPVPLPRQKLMEIEVFPSSTGSTENTFPRNNEINPLVVAEAVQHDEENNPRPSKWNRPAVAFECESTRAYVEAPRERMQLYVDSTEEHSAGTSCASTVQNNVLRERKDPEVDLKDEYSDTSCNYVKPQQGGLRMMCRKEFYPVREKEVSFEQRMRDRWLKLESEKAEKVHVLGSEVQNLKTALSSREEELKQFLTSRQEERNRMESKLRSKISECQNLAQELENEKRGNQQLMSELANREKKHAVEVEQCKAKHLQLSTLLSTAETKIQELVDSLSEMKARNEELTALMSQQQANSENSSATNSSSGPSSNECTFVPRSSSQTINGNAGGTTILAADQTARDHSMLETTSFSNFSRADVSDFHPPPTFSPPKVSKFMAKKMAFTLYESQLGSFSCDPRGATGNGPMPQNRITLLKEENQNNIDFHKLSENVPPVSVRLLGTKHLPSHSAPETRQGDFKRPVNRHTLGNVSPLPSTHIYTDNLNDSEMFEPDQGEESPDFNLTNLTRALAFHPEPLLNSTPERNSGVYDRRYENINSGNYIQTMRIPQLSHHQQILSSRDREEFDVEGPLSPVVRKRMDLYRTSEPEPETANNLSPIQETSKESRSNCTTGSSSGNMTSTRGTTISGTSLYNSTQSTRSGGPPSRYQYPNFH